MNSFRLSILLKIRMIIIKSEISINTVRIGTNDIYSSDIFTRPAILSIKNKPKFIANQIKVYIVTN